MKKSTIWLLTIVMAATILGLLSVQIMYMEDMVRMRNEQFSETVKRSLYAVSDALEQDETRYYLEQDLDEAERYQFEHSDRLPSEITDPISSNNQLSDKQSKAKPEIGKNEFGFIGQYENRQAVLKGQYLYQKGILNEVILSILNQASDRPITERADSAKVNSYLKKELESNGLEVPFEFALQSPQQGIVYYSAGYDASEEVPKLFTTALFPKDPEAKRNILKVYFPTQSDYIYASIKFMIPSFVFTFILMFTFIYTIVVIFRQKKLSEIKTDFINNMTHEFKTPISTISLAGQMLNDETVLKSPTMMKHVSQVISDETKRLRFQVEKVLQMSLFDRNKATIRLKDVDAHAIIDNVVSTYRIKAEKFGGHITADFSAEDSIINVDEMHFTNVIFNLLDNAIKYRREEVEPELQITTRNLPGEKFEIRISDNGIGMKKEDLKKIFEKFYRVHTGNRHDVKGFGLGLAYVSKMIALFKGSIKAESELNKGTTFIITLPLYK